MHFRTVEEMEQLLAQLIAEKDHLSTEIDEHSDMIDDNTIRLQLIGTVVKGRHADLRKEYEERIEQHRSRVAKLEDEIAQLNSRMSDIRQKLQQARQLQINRIACS